MPVTAPIDVPITVFRSQAGCWNKRAGWDLFARAGYHCAEFEGDHDSMFEAPRVYALSEALSLALRTKGDCPFKSRFNPD